MTDRDALYAAVCANPDDDTARLVFADWLDEHRDPERAARLRAGVELRRARAAAPPASIAEELVTAATDDDFDAARHHLLRVDWAAVAPEAAGAFAAAVPVESSPRDVARKVKGVRGVELYPDRGGSYWAHVNSVDGLLRGADVLFRAVPVRALAFDNLTPEEGAALARSGVLRRVRGLRFGVDVSDTQTYSGLREIGAHPDAESIRSLGVAYPPAPAEMVEALAAGAHWSGLRELTFDGSLDDLEAPAVTELLRRPQLRRLRSLTLQDISPGPEVVEALAGGACPDLRWLTVMHCRLNGGAAALARAGGLNELYSLYLMACDVSGEEAGALITTPRLPKLAALNLGYNNFRGPDPKALAGRTRASPLRRLSLRRSRPTPDGLAALTQCKALTGLWALDLRDCGLTTTALRPLLAHAWGDLVVLNLDRNKLNAQVPALIAKWPGARTIQWLDLRANELSKAVPRGKPAKWKAVAALADADNLPNLKVLAVSYHDTDAVTTRRLEARFGAGAVSRDPR